MVVGRGDRLRFEDVSLLSIDRSSEEVTKNEANNETMRVDDGNYEECRAPRSLLQRLNIALRSTSQ